MKHQYYSAISFILCFQCVIATAQSTITRQKDVSIVDVCRLRNLPIDSARSIFISNPQQVIHSIARNAHNEECFYQIVEKLTLLENLDNRTFLALEKIDDFSDGFLGEYLMDVAAGLFEKKFEIFFKYIYANPKSSLVKSAIDGISMELGLHKKNKDEMKVEFLKRLKHANQRKFLDQIFDRIDPTKFD